MGDEGSERLTQPSGHLTAGLLEPQRESETANPLIISFLTFHALLFLTPLLPFALPEALKGSEALRFTLNFSASFPLEQPNPIRCSDIETNPCHRYVVHRQYIIGFRVIGMIHGTRPKTDGRVFILSIQYR